VTRDGRQSALASRLGSLGGLADLAGLTDVTGGSKAEAVATLQSEVVTEKYIRDRDLLPILYAKKWDATRKVWLETDPEKIPTPWKANLLFTKQIREVAESKRNNLVTLTITWKDPVLAAKWANELVTMTNDYMRQITIEQAEANMDYLNAQLAKTSAVEMRQTIYNLMEGELKSAMMARGDRNFALKVIDPAVPPEKPSSPVAAVWTLGGFMGGLFLSMGYVIMRPSQPRRKQE
jgi:uncharacterized protein involved in exopolysaccharide biosynthesis